MDTALPSHFWLGLWQIVIVNVLLSGDNAVVIAMACRNLAERYRNRALVFGTLGAVGVRIAFCFMITWLMLIPALKLIGGVLLLWIGVKLMVPEEEDGDAVAAESHLWGAIRTIVIADVVMSLDNVIGIVAAAKGHLLLIIAGLALSIPLIIFGSRLVMGVLNRFPILITAGAGLLGWLAGEIMESDPLVVKTWPMLEHGAIHYVPAVVGVLIVVAIGTWLKRRAEAEHPLPAPVEHTK
jgi:YjbE family integral membrane protein